MRFRVDSKKAKKTHTEKKSTPDNKFDGINFKKLKGKLKLPVKGKITRKFWRTIPSMFIPDQDMK